MVDTMHNETLYNLVRSIQPIDSLEQAHKSDALEWIASGSELYRLEKPATPPKHLVSYSVVLDVERKVWLLVDHKKALLWLPPGGHVEPGEHPAITAQRELKEELNVDLPLIQPDPFFLTVTETGGTTPGHVDVSLWYLFHGDASKTYHYDTNEFHSIRWFPFPEQPLKRSTPHMSRLSRKIHCFSDLVKNT